MKEAAVKKINPTSISKIETVEEGSPYAILIHKIINEINKSLTEKVHKDTHLSLYRGNIVLETFVGEINPKVIGAIIYIQYSSINTLNVTRLVDATPRDADSLVILQSDYLYESFTESTKINFITNKLYERLLINIVTTTLANTVNNIFASINKIEQEHKAKQVEISKAKEAIGEPSNEEDHNEEALEERKVEMTIVK